MRIIYDDLNEFAEVVIRCTDTARKNMCDYCPFYDRCYISEKDSRHIMYAEIQRSENGT